MKLSEIKMIPSNPATVFKLPQIVIDSAKIIGKSDHRDVYSASFNDTGKHYVFFNKDDSGVTSFVVVNELHLFDRDIAEVIRTWTRDDLQRKGYLSALLKFIRDLTKMSIMSVKEQTPDSRAFWAAVAKKFDVQMIDMVTGHLQHVDDQQVYSLADTEKYRLFVESYEFIPGVGKVPNTQKSLKEWVDSVLPPYIYFTEGDI